MRKGLLAIALILFLALPAWAGTWKETCWLMGVNPDGLVKPQVILVHEDNPIIKDCLAIYIPYWNTVFTTTFRESVLAHEYAHAVMSSPAYQEPRARAMEKHFGED